MKLFDFLLRSSWITVAIAILTGFISGGSSAGLIAVISHALNPSTHGNMTSLLWSFCGLALISLLTSIFSQLMLIRLSQDAVFQLRMGLSQQILSAELSHIEQTGAARLLATLTEDVQAVSNAVFSIPFLCIDLAIVVGCLVYITWLSWLVLLLVCGFVVLALGSCQLLLGKGNTFLGLAREDQDRLFSHFRTVTDGVKELKLNYQRREAFLREDLQTTAQIYRRHNILGLSFFASTSSWGKLLFFFAAGFVIFALPKLITLNPQTLSGYILTFMFLLLPMDNLVNNLPVLSKAGIALQKVESLGLSLSSESEVPALPSPVNPQWYQLQLSGLTRAYHQEGEDHNFIFGPVDLTFHPGELVFIVGGNGSGKSTLAKLLTGLYLPESGQIRLDNTLIGAENREWYRQHFAVVFSDFYLFERLLGMDDPNLDQRAKSYLEKLELSHKVRVEDGYLSTTALSQGQRKRLTLLTAYLEDRPIYLFDEWAADQDPLFKSLFYNHFLTELRDRGKTVLVISHDEQYFPIADRVIKLDYGKVSELIPQ